MSDSRELDEAVDTLVPSLKLSVHAKTTSSAATAAARAAEVAQSRHVDDAVEQRPRPRGVRAGDIIGERYIVEGTIGRGGMGRVLCVRHQALGKGFALKVIKVPIANSPRIRDMFYREARLASALSHDNICSVVDFGEDEQFGLFMVMELLEGTTLFKKVQHDGRVPPKVACDIVWQVGEALRYIHSRAIIHGDIKSENIFLTRTPDRRRVVKLLDFGLARAEAALRGAGGRVEGTPHYLAPERIHGDPPSQQSDIYALGVLFFELLVGKHPFLGSVEEIFRQHLEVPVPVPSSQIDEPLDERADELVVRAMAKEPSERHSGVAGFLYELRTLMNMLGVDAKGRRRPAQKVVPQPARPKEDRAAAAKVEAFELAPIPLASVDTRGKVRVANRAFLEFLGIAGSAAGIDLAHSGLTEVYPALISDMLACAESGRPIKRVVYLSEGGGHVVQVAFLMTPAPGTEAPITGGEIHLAVHPLGEDGRR